MTTKTHLQSGSAFPITTDLPRLLKILARAGYKASFKMTDRGLTCMTNGVAFTPSQIRLEQFYRLEGISDPSDDAILYAIAASDGTKGTIIDAYGIYSDTSLGDFMKDVKIGHKH